MVVGLVKPESGRVWLDDRDVTRMPMFERARAGIGYSRRNRRLPQGSAWRTTAPGAANERPVEQGTGPARGRLIKEFTWARYATRSASR